MREKIVLAALMLLALGTFGQETPPPVGVDEHLGAQLPTDISLLDEKGNAVPLQSLLGKPTILTLNYYRCAGICTPLLNGVVDVAKKSDLVAGRDYQILTVSFDPTDAPDLAGRKRDNYLKQLPVTFDPAGWRFLTGAGDQTKRLADAVGFQYRAELSPEGTTEFAHPAAIMILSPSGTVIRYMYGITFLPFDLKMAVAEANAGRPGPTINKLLKFCYSYDPAGRKYKVNVTRIAGVGTLLLAGLLASLLVARKKPAEVEAPGRDA